MTNIPQIADVAETLDRFLASEFPLEAFEQWVYASHALESAVGAEHHFALLSLDYRARDARHEAHRLAERAYGALRSVQRARDRARRDADGMGSNRLRLTLARHDDGSGELTVQASANRFAGCGTAWFNLSDISTFGRALATYPLGLASPPTLVSGFWNSDRTIKQEHVFLAVRPWGVRDGISIAVRLATPVSAEDRPTSQSRVALELYTGYAALAPFVSGLVSLAAGDAAEAVLEVEPTGER